uniref:NB-ARC domain-containing protein n=1 Tax=Oryza punctata TaxID=4537 RepID=A0A0E0JZT4_ORYPU
MAAGGLDLALLGPTISLASIVLSEFHRTRAKKKVADTLEKDLAFIKKEFEMMQPFLMDAAKSTATTASFKAWFQRIRDLAHDAEDTIHEFFLHVEKPSRATNSKLLLPLDIITKQLSSLRSDIDHVKSNWIYTTTTPVPPQSNPRTTVTASRNSTFIGRESEKAHLIQLISQDQDQFQIISIWGMIGIGKTSLIRSVYESEEISSLFEQRAWVTISHPFNLHEFVTSLTQELDAHNFVVLGNDSTKNGEEIKASNRRRCFIILDDVLSIEEWNMIQPHLPGERNTHIIAITNDASIAEHCSTTYKYIYKLESLKDNAALALFKNKVFMDSSNVELHLDMETQAKLIIKECDGHPLALTNIAGFLARRPKTAMEWKKFNESFSAGSGSNRSLGMISAALTLSYDDLPYHLKLCFLYLCLFPKGHNIRRRRLTRRWVAEGYTSKTHNLSAEEVGENYFLELINRSIIQPAKTGAHNAENIEYCRVHNLIHKISILKSMEENHGFLLDSSSNNQGTVRHVSIITTDEINKNTLKDADLSHVRSVTVIGEWREYLDSSKMRLLRVLDLEGTSDLKDRDLEQIGNFLHLRYFSLRGCADINQLPDSIGNLWDLQVLDVSGTNITKLPKTIIKLKMLQYLRAGKVPKDDLLSSSELKGSNNLSKMVHEAIDGVELPDVVAKTLHFSTTALDTIVDSCKKTVQSTSNFKKRDIFNALLPHIPRGVDMYGVEAPDGIGQLNDLLTLGVVNVAIGKTILPDLEKLKKLRKLGLTGINKKNSQYVMPAIANLALLHTLSLQAEGESGLQGCLDNKFSPPSKLQSLKIYGNLVTLPTWITQLESLAKLKLRNTQLELALSLEVLGKLPHLAILRLWKNSFLLRKKLCFDFQQGTFPSLVVLEMKDLEGLKSLCFTQGAIPRLELLQIENCIHLDNNGFSGVSSLPSLKEVMLKGDHNEELMKNLRNQLAMNQNQPILKEA